MNIRSTINIQFEEHKRRRDPFGQHTIPTKVVIKDHKTLIRNTSVPHSLTSRQRTISKILNDVGNTYFGTQRVLIAINRHVMPSINITRQRLTDH